ncbi:hypothetical protein predicted by Glimmer/Critica [Sorangium cellulosum So ce56]|uniref:Uncharacterized protein n=1 Tax=Sorangium cellulosum (strain So ce56) TaxID=448385 RepID=A9FE77_SORC5|nr:hypothetical protein predicted by Glimmer/Critica [Sorangium cellulosum So ce56]
MLGGADLAAAFAQHGPKRARRASSRVMRAPCPETSSSSVDAERSTDGCAEHRRTR